MMRIPKEFCFYGLLTIIFPPSFPLETSQTEMTLMRKTRGKEVTSFSPLPVFLFPCNGLFFFFFLNQSDVHLAQPPCPDLSGKFPGGSPA